MLFKAGKKYMLSKRKCIKNGEPIDNIIKSLIGVKFLVTKEMVDFYSCGLFDESIIVDIPADGIQFPITSDMCIEVK